MRAETRVETYCLDGQWRNRLVPGRHLPGTYATRGAAASRGYAVATRRGVVHVVVYTSNQYNPLLESDTA